MHKIHAPNFDDCLRKLQRHAFFGGTLAQFAPTHDQVGFLEGVVPPLAVHARRLRALQAMDASIAKASRSMGSRPGLLVQIAGGQIRLWRVGAAIKGAHHEEAARCSEGW